MLTWSARAGCLLLALPWLYVAWHGRHLLHSSKQDLVDTLNTWHHLWRLPLILALAAPLLIAFGRHMMRVPRVVFAVGMAILGAIIAHKLQVSVLRGLPQISDEFGYLLQARTFAHGALAAPLPQPSPFFYASWSFHSHGRWIVAFPPGYALLASVFALFGHVNVANPCIGAGVTALVYLVAGDLLGESTARLAACLWVACEYRALNDAAWMSHPTAALFALLAVLCAWRGLGRPERAGMAYSVGAGAAVTYLLATRPLNALIITVALLPLGVARLLRAPRRTLITVGLAVAGAVPLLGLYAAYNHDLTGRVTTPPQLAYFAAKEEQADCFRLGFGKTVDTCDVTQGVMFDDGYTPKDALDNTKKRLTAWSWNVFGAACLLALALLPVLAASVGLVRRTSGVLLAALIPTLQVAAYALFFYHGVTPEYGSRFTYEATPFAVMLVAVVLTGLCRLALGGPTLAPLLARITRRPVDPAKWRPVARVAVSCACTLPLGLLLACHVAGAVVAANTFYGPAHDRPNSMNGDAGDAVAGSPDVHHALVLTSSCCLTPLYLMDPVHLDRNDLIFTRDYGPRFNALLFQSFPDRKPYVLGHDKLLPYAINPALLKGVYIEAEQYGSDELTARAEAFARHVPYTRASDGAALTIHASNPGGFVELTFPVPQAGWYTATMGFMEAPQFGTVRADLDGQNIGGDVNLYGSIRVPDSRRDPYPRFLAAGPHVVRLTVVAKGPSDDSLRGALDYVELDPAEAPPEP
jgi:hypothetical protein